MPVISSYQSNLLLSLVRASIHRVLCIPMSLCIPIRGNMDLVLRRTIPPAAATRRSRRRPPGTLRGETRRGKCATAVGAASRCPSAHSAGTSGVKDLRRQPAPLVFRSVATPARLPRNRKRAKPLAKGAANKERTRPLVKRGKGAPHGMRIRPRRVRPLDNRPLHRPLPFASSTRILAPPPPRCRKSPNPSSPIFPLAWS